jgi:hypothetical protein
MTTDRELDLMYETALAEDWEEQNRTIVIAGVHPALDAAYSKIKEGCELLSDAVSKAEGYPVEFRIESVLNDMEKLQEEINRIRKEVKP